MGDLASFSRTAVLGLLLAGLVACGGSSTSTPAAPTPTPPTPPTPGGGTQATTFTITASGVSPKTLTVSAGTQVTFINQDQISHEMFSDPHPEHTDCPEINQVGFLSPGQTRQTGNLNTTRTCGFHDHTLPSSVSLQGTITIR